MLCRNPNPTLKKQKFFVDSFKIFLGIQNVEFRVKKQEKLLFSHYLVKPY